MIYLNDEVLGILIEAGRVKGLGHSQVFTYKGQPIMGIRTAFLKACRRTGIEDFRFHDLRHTFNTNMRKAGVDQSVIMKLTGHKTAAMFHHYNTVDTADAVEAYQKFEGFLAQEPEEVTSGKLCSGAKNAPIVLPDERRGSRSYPKCLKNMVPLRGLISQRVDDKFQRTTFAFHYVSPRNFLLMYNKIDYLCRRRICRT